MTLYIPGYQISRFKGTNVRFDDKLTTGNLKGNINHLTAKGDGIVNNIIFGLDVTEILLTLTRGIKNSAGSFYGGIFDTRIGYAMNIGDQTLFGAAIDLGARGMNYVKDTIDLSYAKYYFITTGITFVGLHSFDERIYLMPKLSLNPMFGKDVDKITDGLSVKFETSIGYRITEKFGFSITPGIDRMKFLYMGKSADNQDEVQETKINITYLQFGLSFMMD